MKIPARYTRRQASASSNRQRTDKIAQIMSKTAVKLDKVGYPAVRTAFNQILQTCFEKLTKAEVKHALGDPVVHGHGNTDHGRGPVKSL
jgi:hypothetical protein